MKLLIGRKLKSTWERRSTTTRMINGDHAYSVAPKEGRAYDSLSCAGGSFGKCHSSLGLQNASRITTATTVMIAAKRSASAGPMRFETRNCVTANTTPLTKM